MSDDIHEVYALAYATHERRRSENYIFGGPHDELTHITYYVWVIKGPHGIFVVDTGFDELAAKTFVSVATAQCLLNTPHKPHLAMTAEQVNQFTIFNYGNYYPVAPGIVLIKAAGHSPDHQMVYIGLQSGREILHSVDVGWVLENIRQVKGKAAPWVKEDVPAVIGQLRWLSNLHRSEKNLTILITHDDTLFDTLTASGAVGHLAL